MFNEKLIIISKWAADMYDQEVTETDDVDFMMSLIGQSSKKILEVCCGSGRILIPLAKAGHTVYGFDADEFMLAKIPEKAKGHDNIKWRNADAVYGDWGTGFDMVVLAGNILFNIVSDIDYEKAQELFIQKASSALVPGGYVYIEYRPGVHRLTQPEESHKDSGEIVVWKGTDKDGNYGRMILLDREYDSITQLDKFTRRFELTLKNGETIKHDMLCFKHFATLEQIRGWMTKAGFSIEKEYGDYNGNAIGENSQKAIIFARKK